MLIRYYFNISTTLLKTEHSVVQRIPWHVTAFELGSHIPQTLLNTSRSICKGA